MKISDITINLDNKRKPLNGEDRNQISIEKKYPYCGANNIMDYVDEYLFDEEIICIAEDGGKWGADETCSYIMNEKNVKPWNILAITFTNKAASEMKERIEKLVGGQATNDMWIGTFHSICVRMLRRYIDRIGYNSDFVIFDTSDQKTLIKQCIKSLNLNEIFGLNFC